jgi:hypothetical protein
MKTPVVLSARVVPSQPLVPCERTGTVPMGSVKILIAAPRGNRRLAMPPRPDGRSPSKATSLYGPILPIIPIGVVASPSMGPLPGHPPATRVRIQGGDRCTAPRPSGPRDCLPSRRPSPSPPPAAMNRRRSSHPRKRRRPRIFPHQSKAIHRSPAPVTTPFATNRPHEMRSHFPHRRRCRHSLMPAMRLHPSRT